MNPHSGSYLSPPAPLGAVWVKMKGFWFKTGRFPPFYASATEKNPNLMDFTPFLAPFGKASQLCLSQEKKTKTKNDTKIARFRNKNGYKNVGLRRFGVKKKGIWGQRWSGVGGVGGAEVVLG